MSTVGESIGAEAGGRFSWASHVSGARRHLVVMVTSQDAKVEAMDHFGFTTYIFDPLLLLVLAAAALGVGVVLGLTNRIVIFEDRSDAITTTVAPTVLVLGTVVNGILFASLERAADDSFLWGTPASTTTTLVCGAIVSITLFISYVRTLQANGTLVGQYVFVVKLALAVLGIVVLVLAAAYQFLNGAAVWGRRADAQSEPLESGPRSERVYATGDSGWRDHYEATARDSADSRVVVKVGIHRGMTEVACTSIEFDAPGQRIALALLVEAIDDTGSTGARSHGFREPCCAKADANMG